MADGPVPAWRIDRGHLDHAAGVVGRHLSKTPLRKTSEIGPGLWLKLECQQETGSFKVRGALARLAALTPEERGRGVVSASAGNHGAGLAWAGRRLGVPVRVVVPSTTPAVKRERIVAHGAELQVVDLAGYDQAEEAARAEAARRGAVHVSPYDDPWVAAGNGGTVALEIFDALPDAGTLVVPVGGGGLLAGVAAGCRRLGLGPRLVGVQSGASPAMALSFERGVPVERYHCDSTLAEGLEGGVSPTSFWHARQILDRVELVSEAEIAGAMRFAARRLDLAIEGSAAVALAWVRRELPAPDRSAPPVVALITGGNVDPEVLQSLLASSTT